ncbi:MAG: amidohydrolase family protein [Acetobacteraceae bacterium]|nr:amidohydrolase family protein [Acetobacteraceae bacterium]
MPFQGLRIIDSHAHFPVSRPRPEEEGGGSPVAARRERHPLLAEYNRERMARMRAAWNFPDPDPPAATDEEIRAYADAYVADLDRWGVERIVFVTGGGDEELARIVALHPDRFIGLSHVRIWEDGALERLREGVEVHGLRGLKMFGPTLPVPFEDPKLRPIWQYLADHRLPVLCHFGWLGHGGGVVHHPRMSPLTIEPVAREFLDMPVIVPHFGCGYMEDLMALCWSLPNVLVDTSGSNQWMDWMPYPMDVPTALRRFYDRIGPERIIFGTDSSWRPRGFVGQYLELQTRAAREMRIPEEDLALIFAGNAARIYRIGTESGA